MTPVNLTWSRTGRPDYDQDVFIRRLVYSCEGVGEKFSSSRLRRNSPRVDELCTKYGDKRGHRSKYGNIRDQIRFLKLFDSHPAVLPTPLSVLGYIPVHLPRKTCSPQKNWALCLGAEASPIAFLAPSRRGITTDPPGCRYEFRFNILLTCQEIPLTAYVSF